MNELNVSTNTVDADVLLNDVINDSVIESVDCNRDDESDDVGDAKQNAEETSIPDETLTHDIASCQQVAEEQRSDETLQGCFKLAKAGKGGFEIHDNLLHHRKTVAGESFLQLVVPKARRKHVLNLCHDVFGGHMAVKRTKEGIELTFYWPTLHDDCREYVRTCHVCQVKKRKTRRDQIPITHIQRSDRLFEHFFAGCAGPFNSGEGTKPKYNYAFIAVDSFSWFPFCAPLKSLHAKAMCEGLLSIWQFTGVFSHLLTDLASNFVSKLTQQFEKMMGCSSIFNSPLHPQATGLAERGVGNVKAIIGKLALDHPTSGKIFFLAYYGV